MQFFIQKYVDEEIEKNNLSASEKRSLLDTIHTGFLLKSIESSDIEFNEQRIMQIKTLKWNENIRKYELQIQSRSQKPSRKSESQSFSQKSSIEEEKDQPSHQGNSKRSFSHDDAKKVND